MPQFNQQNAPQPVQAETIPALIKAAAECFGDRIFIDEGDLTLSFTESYAHAQKVAASLINLGVKSGDRVAIWAPNIHEWILAAMGIHCAGAILVTLNTRYKGQEAGFILRNSRARLLFSIGTFLDCDYPAQLDGQDLPDLANVVVFRESSAAYNEPAADSKLLSWERFLQSGEHIPNEVVTGREQQVLPKDTADILFTSGTTGEPKGVMSGHQQNLRNFSNWGELVGIGSNDRYLVINPFFHSFGYKAGLLACLLYGTRLLPQAVFDSAEVLRRIANERITVMPGPPTLFQSLLAHPDLDQYDISSLKRITTGAAVIPVELIRQIKSRLGVEVVITAYGLTESCGLVTSCRRDDSAETIAETSGRAIPGVEVRCVDSTNQALAAGETGEIVVRGYNLMQGYFENPEATAKAIDSEGWLHTGDVGNLDSSGNLRITDRLKDMFITGGFNCYPAEIENILARHPAIVMSAVVGAPDTRLGEVAAAFVVLKPGHDLDEHRLLSWCKDNMANYKVPRQVSFLEALPLNASGKVVKMNLRKQVSC